MEVGSLFFLLAIIVVVLIIITQPLYLAGKSLGIGKAKPSNDPVDDGEYQGIVKNIRELTADYELGKLSGEDFAAQRKLLEDQAFLWLKAQDGIPVDKDTEAAQEHEIEQMIHSRRMNRAEQTSGFCPRCGRPVQKSDQFCPSCGEPTGMIL